MNDETTNKDGYAPNGANPTTKPLPNVPLVENDYTAGNASPASLSYEVSEVKEVSDIPNPAPTLQLTDSPQLLDEEGTEINILYQGDPATSEYPYRNVRAKYGMNRPRPFSIMRGTNVLIPFGASYSATVTAAGGEGVTDPKPITTLNTLNLGELESFSGNFRSRASLRECRNYKAFGEMKDAIISYRSRSIAYTNLSQSDMFALEIQREAAMANAAMPLFAACAARSYLKMLTQRGYKFNSCITSLVTDPDVLKEEYLLYVNLKNMKTFDPTLWTRLGMLTKLHQGSMKNGLMPNLIIQDVVVTGLPKYKPNVSISATSGSYNIKIPDVFNYFDSNGIGNKISFARLVSMYLPWSRRGVTSYKDLLIKVLTKAQELANAIVNGMKIITGAIDVIEANRGAKFDTIDQYLPIKGVHLKDGSCVVDFEDDPPVFSYYYKERFEYAPVSYYGEDATGANTVLFTYNLAMIRYPAFVQISPFSKSYVPSTYLRPVGPHKGEEVWKTDEIAYIGVYKHGDPSDVATSMVLQYAFFGDLAPTTNSGPIFTNDPTFKNQNFGPIQSTLNAKIGAGALVYEDVLYGDIYTPLLAFPSQTDAYSDDEVFPTGYGAFFISDVVAYAGSGLGTNFTYFPSPIPYGYDDASEIFTGLTGLSVNSGGVGTNWTYSLMDFTTPNVAMTIETVKYIEFVYNELDLAKGCVIYPTNKTVGVADTPIVWQSNYRGAYWLVMTATTLENMLITMGSDFYMTYKNNAEIRSEKAGMGSQHKPPVANA